MAIFPVEDKGGRELSELVACTLTNPDLKTQSERWINLGESFGIGRYQTEAGLRLTFRDHPAVAAELQTLVSVESECCSWATWTVASDGNGILVMEARSQGDGITTLHGMFTAAGGYGART